MLTKIIWNKEYELVIKQDDTPDSPRNWDNLWTLVTAHRSYSWDEELPSDAWDIDEAFDVHLKSKWLTIDDIYYHKVYLYEHSWVRISTAPFGCRWDSGQWWYIYISKDKIKEENIENKTKKEILEYLESEIEVLDQYYQWDVYMYTVESRGFVEQDWKKFYEENWTIEDLSWGFYWKDWVLDMSEYIEHFNKEDCEKLFEELYY